MWLFLRGYSPANLILVVPVLLSDIILLFRFLVSISSSWRSPQPSLPAQISNQHFLTSQKRGPQLLPPKSTLLLAKKRKPATSDTITNIKQTGISKFSKVDDNITSSSSSKVFRLAPLSLSLMDIASISSVIASKPQISQFLRSEDDLIQTDTGEDGEESGQGAEREGKQLRKTKSRKRKATKKVLKLAVEISSR